MKRKLFDMTIRDMERSEREDYTRAERERALTELAREAQEWGAYDPPKDGELEF